MRKLIAFLLVCALLVPALLAGCKQKKQADETLVVYSPNNDDIKNEFERAFAEDYKARTGKTVAIEWRDVGGGGVSIVSALRNAYSGGKGTCEADILWGGGDQSAIMLAQDKLLEPLTLPKDVTDNIPAQLAGVQMYDLHGGWCGTCLSAFGLLYNRQLLQRRGLAEPATWDDLGKGQYRDLLALADPTQSSSAAAAYEMIVQSSKDWPAGWAKLLAILGNANKFESSASDATRAVENGSAAIATCIDFYGQNSVASHKGQLAFVLAKGQTAFTCDPIAVLKGPPHPELAREFVAFVLSAKGQALWALKKGSPGGPVQKELGRQPIRRDVYDKHAADFLPLLANPYKLAGGMTLDVQLKQARGDVLNLLVRATAVDNAQGLKAARKKLADHPNDRALLEEYNRLPANVDTTDEIYNLADQIKDPAKADVLANQWDEFFRAKYRKINQ